MKAAIYQGQKAVEVRELPDPVCGDNDVVIQNIYSSICGTDVAVYLHGPNTGHRVTVGGEFGHETVSRIVQVGKNVTDFQVGERVMLCDVSDFRLGIAGHLGFAVCNTEKEDFIEQATAYFGTAPALMGLKPDIDCWIFCT